LGSTFHQNQGFGLRPQTPLTHEAWVGRVIHWVGLVLRTAHPQLISLPNPATRCWSPFTPPPAFLFTRVNLRVSMPQWRQRTRSFWRKMVMLHERIHRLELFFEEIFVKKQNFLYSDDKRDNFHVASSPAICQSVWLGHEEKSSRISPQGDLPNGFRRIAAMDNLSYPCFGWRDVFRSMMERHLHSFRRCLPLLLWLEYLFILELFWDSTVQNNDIFYPRIIWTAFWLQLHRIPDFLRHFGFVIGFQQNDETASTFWIDLNSWEVILPFSKTSHLRSGVITDSLQC
jgi:hypothetical protein